MSQDKAPSKLTCTVGIQSRLTAHRATNAAAATTRHARCLLSLRFDDKFIVLRFDAGKLVEYPLVDNVAKVIYREDMPDRATICLKRPDHNLLVRVEQSEAARLKAFLKSVYDLVNGRRVQLGKRSVNAMGEERRLSAPATVDTNSHLVTDTKIRKLDAEAPKSLGRSNTVTPRMTQSENDPNSSTNATGDTFASVRIRQVGVAKSAQPLVMRIERRVDYPTVLGSFPPSLREFTAINIALRRFDSRLLALCNLRVLDLSGNLLGELPDSVGNLRLEFLSVARNTITTWPQCLSLKVRCQPNALLESLVQLDISGNRLSCVPSCVWSLPRLRLLRVARNALERLPIFRLPAGHVSSLRTLDASENQLRLLPAGFDCMRRLESVDLSANPFISAADTTRHNSEQQDAFDQLGAGVHTLLQFCLATARMHALAEHAPRLPDAVRALLESDDETVVSWCARCACCFYHAPLEQIERLDLAKVASEVTLASAADSREVPVRRVFCSMRCFAAGRLRTNTSDATITPRTQPVLVLA